MTHTTEVLADRYELLEELGRGGMGVVYAAMDRSLQRRVAVKVLPADRAADPLLVARFEREALAAAALSHRNIVAVFDTGRHEDTHYIVMEYLRGQSLSQLLHTRGVLPVPEAVSVASQIASALAAAHAAGIVHRDIKPANVMVAPDGAVKVLDFGIARMASSTTLTHASMVLGSAPYMAPEVAQGKPADARSDIYSLGCVLYELLTGQAPFTGELAAAVLHQHSTAAPQPVAALNPGVPAGLDALVLRMLAKEPDARPQHAEELIERLADPRAPGGASSEPLPPTAAIRPLPPTAATRPLPPSAPTRRLSETAATRPLPRSNPVRRPRMLAGGALALALAAILAIVLASGGGRGRPVAAKTHHTSTRRSAATGTGTASGSTTPPSTTTPSSTATTPSTATTSTAASTTGTTATTGTTSAPATPAAAAGQLSTLLTQDLQAGTIDQQAGQQIEQQLQGLANQYEQGHSDNALKQLPKLQQQLAALTQHGDITAAAAPGLAAAVSTLSTALAGAATPAGGDGSDHPGPGPAGPKPHGGPKHDH